MQHDLSDEELALSDTGCDISPHWPSIPIDMRKGPQSGSVQGSNTADAPFGTDAKSSCTTCCAALQVLDIFATLCTQNLGTFNLHRRYK